MPQWDRSPRSLCQKPVQTYSYARSEFDLHLFPAHNSTVDVDIYSQHHHLAKDFRD